MGATQFSRVGRGKTANEAFQSARENAINESGTTYSGDLGAKHGFTLIVPPSGMSPRDWANLLMREELPVYEEKHRWLFDRHFNIYDDKWASALCIQLEDTKWLFFGMASD